jgi:hypothetical protein
MALSQIKSGRAPGPVGVSAEILKQGGIASVQWLKAISDQVWKNEAVPCSTCTLTSSFVWHWASIQTQAEELR